MRQLSRYGRRKYGPRYGIDAPGVLAGLILTTLGGIAAAAMLGRRHRVIGSLLLVSGLYNGACAANFAYTTLRGKFDVWAEELGQLRLAGDERVLDLGCGRGAVSTMVAPLVPRGRVTGVDLWRQQDQSGNTPDEVARDAGDAGVADRIDLVTGDMRRLPLLDGRFDLVVSSLAVHNIRDADGRAQAMSEVWLVLRPSDNWRCGHHARARVRRRAAPPRRNRRDDA